MINGRENLISIGPTEFSNKDRVSALLEERTYHEEIIRTNISEARKAEHRAYIVEIDQLIEKLLGKN